MDFAQPTLCKLTLRLLCCFAVVALARSKAEPAAKMPKDGNCHIGKFAGTSLNTGKKGCFPCPSGKYGIYGAGETGCIDCDIGEYQKFYGKTSCDKCPKSNLSAAELKHCRECGEGSYLDSGTLLCVKCDVGTFQPYVGSKTPCYKCKPGKHAPEVGALKCTECASGTWGKFDDGKKRSVCKACEPNSYQNQSGQVHPPSPRRPSPLALDHCVYWVPLHWCHNIACSQPHPQVEF